MQGRSEAIEYEIKKDTLRPPEDVFGPISTPTEDYLTLQAKDESESKVNVQMISTNEDIPKLEILLG